MTHERMLVIGHGYAGRRFAGAATHLARIGEPVRVVGVCDLRAEMLDGLPDDVPGFASIENALDEVDPTIICVTVSEREHASVLSAIAGRHPTLILSEKPLTSTLDEAETLRPRLAHHQISMNLVERFSPITSEADRVLRTERNLTPIRVEFFWGKHRVRDPRDTIGVLSELTHPLDLVQLLFGVPIEIEQTLHSGGFLGAGEHVLDSIDFYARQADRSLLIGHSSFAWPRRQRTISALLSDGADRLLRLNLEFDTPHWDDDTLVVEEIGAEGHYTALRTLRVAHGDQPEDLRGILKVAAYMQRSISSWRSGQHDDLLVDLDGAIRLQRDLERMLRSVPDVDDTAP